MTGISNTHFIVHDSTGLKFFDGHPSFDCNSTDFNGFEGKVRSFAVSENGKRLAWIAGGEVCVVEHPSWHRIGTLHHPRAQEVCFSPRGNYVAVWDTFIKSEGSEATPNLSVYDVEHRKLLKAFFQQSQVNWQPQWTKDELVFGRIVTSEAHFYKADDLQTVVVKKVLPKLRSFSLSPSTEKYHVTFFVPSSKGAPAFVRLHEYPSFQDGSALSNKSFYKVDTVETIWNKQSTSLLLLTTAEGDKSGTSYYGEQMLFFLSTRGDSIRVTFSKKGNIRSVAWCPDGLQFFAVYGTAPAKATLFNSKCDPIAEFGEAARNTVMVNPVGNVVLLGGFGNISPRFETWDISTQKQLGYQECPDVTHIEWSPCGQYLLTSTCSPRLRVNNGYKIWHYSASLLHEKISDPGTELYRTAWIPDDDVVKPFAVSTKKVQGIQSSVKTASSQRYIPPSQRAAFAEKGGKSDTRKFLSQHDEPMMKTEPSQPPKSDKKNKKKSGSKQPPSKLTDAPPKDGSITGGSTSTADTVSEACDHPREASNATATDLSRGKKIKNIKKKLHDIAKWKAQQEAGTTLNQKQLNQISSESKLLEELKALKLC